VLLPTAPGVLSHLDVASASWTFEQVLQMLQVMEAPCSPSASGCQQSRHPRRLNMTVTHRVRRPLAAERGPPPDAAVRGGAGALGGRGRGGGRARRGSGGEDGGAGRLANARQHVQHVGGAGRSEFQWCRARARATHRGCARGLSEAERQQPGAPRCINRGVRGRPAANTRCRGNRGCGYGSRRSGISGRRRRRHRGERR
jgi:hypothetical protein